MDESTHREKILKKVRNALISKTANPYPNLDMDSSVFNDSGLPAEVEFAEQFTAQNGQFVLCNDRVELMESLLLLCDSHKFKDVVCIDRNLSAFFDEFEFPHQSVFEYETDTNIEAAIVPCECLVTRTGGIVYSQQVLTDERILEAAHNIIVIAHAYQLATDLNEALSYIKANNSGILPSQLLMINGKVKLNLHDDDATKNAASQNVIVVLVQHDMGEKE